jgi:hypothetical protein
MGYERRTKAVLIAEQMLEAIKSGRGLARSGFCRW